jgi:polyketide cyclase/dehydrase/lipid transport protein
VLRRKFRKLRLWPAVVFSCVAMQAHAAEVRDVVVTRQGAAFVISMHLAIDAPAPAVFRALQDYAAMAHFNPDLRAVRVEPTKAPDRMRLFTTIHTCVLVFCKTMHEEQIMTANATANGGVLDAELVRGDFKGGHGRWVVRPCQTPGVRRTCMDVRIELVPAFWVPPVIGSWVMRRKMDEEARRTSAGLERTASALPLAPLTQAGPS